MKWKPAQDIQREVDTSFPTETQSHKTRRAVVQHVHHVTFSVRFAVNKNLVICPLIPPSGPLPCCILYPGISRKKEKSSLPLIPSVARNILETLSEKSPRRISPPLKVKKKIKTQTEEGRHSNPIEKHQHHVLSSSGQYCCIQTRPGEGTPADKGVIEGVWCPFICSFIDGREPSGGQLTGRSMPTDGEPRCRRRRSQSRLPACAARVSLRSVVSSTSVWNWKWKWMNDEGGNRRLWRPGYYKPKKKGLSGVLCYWLLITAAVETVRKSQYQQTADELIGNRTGRTAGADRGELRSPVIVISMRFFLLLFYWRSGSVLHLWTLLLFIIHNKKQQQKQQQVRPVIFSQT